MTNTVTEERKLTKTVKTAKAKLFFSKLYIYLVFYI